MEYQEFQKILPEVVNSARPSKDTLSQIGHVSFVMTVGPSGAGKTTIMDRLGYPFVLSDTTRQPRPGEVSGVHYNFRTDYSQLLEEIQIGEFVEVEVGAVGDFYGTKATAYPDEGIAVKALTARKIQEFRELGFGRAITVAVTPPSYEDLIQRLNVHSLTEEQWQGRRREAAQSLALMLEDPEAYFVLNDRVYDAVVQTKLFVEHSSRNYSRDQRARMAASLILARLIKE
jgi:guanylate kinase